MILKKLKNFNFTKQIMYQVYINDATYKRGYLRMIVSDKTEDNKEVYIPIAEELDIILRGQKNLNLQIKEIDGGIIAPINIMNFIFAIFRRFCTNLNKCVLNFNSFEVFPKGSKKHIRRLRKAIKSARNANLSFDSAFLTSHKELICGFERRQPSNKIIISSRVAVVIHLFYVELWDEIEDLLEAWEFSFTLFLTITKPNSDLQARIENAFPDAIISIVENCGRDVRPFLLLLENGAFDNYDLICKIHGKRSLGPNRLPILGDVMRRATFLDLIANPLHVRTIIQHFAEDPRLGIVGPKRFLVQSSTNKNGDPIRVANRAAVLKIASRLKMPIDEKKFNFFAGTMFWIRPAAISNIKSLNLSHEFEPESGFLDGALEHAVERIFNHAVKASGYKVKDTSEIFNTDE